MLSGNRYYEVNKMSNFKGYDPQVLKKIAFFLKQTLGNDYYSFDVLKQKFESLFPEDYELEQTISSGTNETLIELANNLPNHVRNPYYEKGTLRDIYSLIGNLEIPEFK